MRIHNAISAIQQFRLYPSPLAVLPSSQVSPNSSSMIPIPQRGPVGGSCTPNNPVRAKPHHSTARTHIRRWRAFLTRFRNHVNLGLGAHRSSYLTPQGKKYQLTTSVRMKIILRTKFRIQKSKARTHMLSNNTNPVQQETVHFLT